MFARIGISTVTDFLVVATLPIRAALGRRAGEANPRYARRVALITETLDGVSIEKSVCTGDAAPCESAVVSLMQERRKIVLDGFPLEKVAEFCFKHNYRWRFHSLVSSQNDMSFIIEPGKSFDATARDVPL
ncbi:MAG TPA: hypothetical protein VJW76_07285 [Verrucomicrobiae bacterium]|nr:hypothetical protein [Verrucomicrobiae bacterium]